MQKFPLLSTEAPQSCVSYSTVDTSEIITYQRRQNSSQNGISQHSTIEEETSPVNSAFCGDAGNRPNDHYKTRLSPLRYSLRTWCLPTVRKETPILAKIQAQMRWPILDFYFAWTANLASHTFYVLMLPPLFWFGASKMGRDLVIVLGLGIYFTGFCKDYLCLPRPRSPPLHRITLLAYTAEEYGWPSSHSANATAVSLVLLVHLIKARDSFETLHFFGLLSTLFIYYFSLIFGRLYCGMHGFLDVATGAVIGLLVFLFRFLLGEVYDDWLLNSAKRNTSSFGIFLNVLFIILAHLFLIHIYPEPVDDCPCFDDSVAFMGVLIGLDISHYACILTGYFATKNEYGDPLLIPFNVEKGLLVMLSRFLLGVLLVVIWKTVLKPLVFTFLPPVYKFLGVNLPRSNFISTAHSTKPTSQIRRQSLSNMKHEPMAEIDSVFENVVRPERDVVGPQGDIDAYELLDYQYNDLQNQIPVKISGVFKARYDVEIIGRCIIYAGISAVTVWGLGYGVIILQLC